MDGLLRIGAMTALLTFMVGCGTATSPDASDDGDTIQSAPETTDSYVPTPEDPDGWTVLYLPATGPYGKQSFEVPAAQNWVNTGLYLKQGQSAKITGEGFWNVTGRRETSPEGAGSPEERGCKIGQLVARINHHFEDPNLHCVGIEATVTADKDGILYVAALIGNDLGETYESRIDATGSLTVTVESDGATVPTVRAVDVEGYDFQKVASGWVEIRGEQIILTLPTATATTDQATLAAAMTRLDTFYAIHTELRGETPYHTQRIRFAPDPTAEGWWMLAGNPIRMALGLVEGDENVRISRAGEVGNDNWGYSHELGHTFTMTEGVWHYQVGGTLEAWPNLFTVHSLQSLDHPQGILNEDCAVTKARHLETGSYEELLANPDIGLCFLLEFHDAYGGWDFYKAFFRDLNDRTYWEIPFDDAGAWGFVRERFGEIAGEDVTPIFDEWGILFE